MSNQEDHRKTWMQAQRDHLTVAGHRCRQAVLTGFEGAGRGLRALARLGGGFLAASWDGRYGATSTRRQSEASLPAKFPAQALRPATTPAATVAEGRLPQQISANPITFMRPNRFSAAAIAPPVQRLPIFDVGARESARKTAEPALSSGTETPVRVKVNPVTEPKTDQQVAMLLEDLFAKKCEEFSSRLERRLDSFCEQTSTRLDLLSEEAVRHFTEALSQQATEALSSLMSDWAEQNRVLLDAECHSALDRFAARLEKVSSTSLESHRKEIRNLSANLKLRLRGVAHALQDLGPASYRS